MLTRLQYPAKPSFIIVGERKAFQDKHKLKEYMATKQALKILEGTLYTEEKAKHIYEIRGKNLALEK